MESNSPISLFVYREGEHFVVPEAVRQKRPDHARPNPLIAALGAEGRDPEGRVVVADRPEDADFFVYPYYLEPIIGVSRTLAGHVFINGLPYYREHEHRHLFFNYHDRGQPLFSHALMFTSDPVRGGIDPNVHPFPQVVGGHVLKAAPDFDFASIDADVGFMGTLSHPVRAVALASLEREKRLRCQISHPGTLKWDDPETSYLHMKDAEKKRAMAQGFVRNMRRSWLSLCPRGMGTSSIRFFETMCMGRIPVHISDGYTLPLADEIDYTEFCVFIPEAEAAITGPYLANWMRKQTEADLVRRCRRARQEWETHFAKDRFMEYAVKVMRRHLAQDPGDWAGRYAERPHELLDRPPCRVYPAGFFEGLELDHRELWINKGDVSIEPDPEHKGMHRVGQATGYLSPGDIGYLFTATQHLRENAVVVEVGSWMGLSSISMANGLVRKGNVSSRIYCVDTWGGSPEHQDMAVIKEDRLYGTFLDNVAQAGVDPLIKPVRKPSVEAAELFRDGRIDLLFVDGDHSYKACYADLCAWYDKVRPGGRIIGHDFYPDSGVERAVERFVAERGLEYVVEPNLRIFRIEKPRQAPGVGLQRQRAQASASV